MNSNCGAGTLHVITNRYVQTSIPRDATQPKLSKLPNDYITARDSAQHSFLTRSH